MGLVAGLAIAFWVGYGISHWETPRGNYYGWRASMALQFIPESVFLLGVFLCPETPRWLVEHGHIDAAKRNLAWLRALSPTDQRVVVELEEIEQDVQKRRSLTNQNWIVLFTNRPLFNRLWRAALLQFVCTPTSYIRMNIFHLR